jgi:hypothetical protein
MAAGLNQSNSTIQFSNPGGTLRYSLLLGLFIRSLKILYNGKSGRSSPEPIARHSLLGKLFAKWQA